MSTNPILDRKPEKPGKVTIERLRQLVDDLNGDKWVQNSGRFYRISVRDGGEKGPIHYLDCSHRGAR